MTETRKRGRPPKSADERLIHISIRVPPAVAAYYRHWGSETAREALDIYMRNHTDNS